MDITYINWLANKLQIDKQIMKKFSEKKLQQVDVRKEQFLVIFMKKFKKQKLNHV